MARFLASPDASQAGIASFTVVSPPGKTTVRSIAISARLNGKGSPVNAFFTLGSREPYCIGGGNVAMTCTLEFKVPAGNERFELEAHGGAAVTSRVESSMVVEHMVAPAAIGTVNVVLGGTVSYLLISLADSAPKAGKSARIPVYVTAADDHGNQILGKYSSPIELSNSDRSGASRLSETKLRTSTSAGRLELIYNGAALASDIITARTAHAPAPAKARFTPGAAAIVSSPALVDVTAGSGGTSVLIGGPQTRAPYTLSTQRDREGDRPCAGLISIERLSPNAFTIVATGNAGECWLATRDRSGHAGSLPVLACENGGGWGPTPSPSPSTGPTAQPTSSPTAQPSSNPTSSPTSSPTAQPTQQPTATPVPGSITLTPSKVRICPSIGSNACANDAKNVLVSQSGNSAGFSESDDCDPSIATVTGGSPSGSRQTFTVTGQGNTGTCTATFTGAGGSQATLPIEVAAPGVTINSARHQ